MTHESKVIEREIKKLTIAPLFKKKLKIKKLSVGVCEANF
jgi:hypothetical protein